MTADSPAPMIDNNGNEIVPKTATVKGKPTKKILGLPAMAVYIGGALILAGVVVLIIKHKKPMPAAASAAK